MQKTWHLEIFIGKIFFFSILLYRVVVMILSNFYYRLHHKITLPSWRNQRFKKTDSYSILQYRIQNSQSSLHYGSWLTGYRKRPDSSTWTHESLDWRMEYGSAISEIYVIFTPCLKYVSRHADHFYICNKQHFEKNLYTMASALRKILKCVLLSPKLCVICWAYITQICSTPQDKQLSYIYS